MTTTEVDWVGAAAVFVGAWGIAYLFIEIARIVRLGNERLMQMRADFQSAHDAQPSDDRRRTPFSERNQPKEKR